MELLYKRNGESVVWQQKKNKVTMALDFIRNNVDFIRNSKYTIFKELGRC